MTNTASRPSPPQADDSHDQTAVTGQSNADMTTDAAPGEERPEEDLKARQDRLLDEALEETFPAGDPTSPGRIT